MAFDIEELNDTNCKTYLVSSEGHGILIDPVRERFETYRMLLRERGLKLDQILETHMHADHLMFNREIKETFGVPIVMHHNSPSPLVDQHVAHGDVLAVGRAKIRVLYTPGHTNDSVSYALDGAVLTGDTLLVGGSGRTDFPGGSAEEQYDSITGVLFALPDDTVVWPAHDYRGNTSTTIGREKTQNPRIAGRTREQYAEIMNNLNLPFPRHIQQALQVNQSGFESDEVEFPTVAEVARASTTTARALADALGGSEPPLVLDVREPEEFVGDLGHVETSLLIPLDMLQRRLPKLAGYSDQDIVVVCRAGARSASACAILTDAGFSRVRNLEGGMVAWKAAGLPVQR